MASEGSFPLNTTESYAYQEADEPTLVMPRVRRPRRRWLRVLLIAVLVLLVAGAVSGAAAYENPALLMPVGSLLLGSQAGAVAWNGSDPINILVMGVDQRTTESTRSDTMIVMHVDPASHTVKMLSVPRDLYVQPPGPYNYYKINAAYELGGPQFSELTVESVLNIPINYYAVLKFNGFKTVVNAMGGVTVCVPRAIHDPQYPDDVGYGWHTLDIKAGCQQMDGTLALEYARERHADLQQDLGRIQQQQALLDGMEKQMLSVGTLLHLPAILSAANGAINTDLPHSALPTLAMILGRAKGSNSQHAYLNVDGGYVTNTVMDGQDVLIGNWPRINTLVSSLFADPKLSSENATVQVLNGQHVTGLAALYTQTLQKSGFNTVAPRDADRNTYTDNEVIVNADRPGADYTARKLAQMLEARTSTAHSGASAPQITVILGSNAAGGN